MLNSKWILTYISVFYLSIFTGRACAFGADGHRIIVGIAENHLSEKTALEIKSITDDLGELSLWPDKIRGIPVWKKSKYWHYINVADHQQVGTAKRSAKGDVLSALNHSYLQLANPELSAASAVMLWDFLSTSPGIFTSHCMWVATMIAAATALRLNGRQKTSAKICTGFGIAA